MKMSILRFLGLLNLNLITNYKIQDAGLDIPNHNLKIIFEVTISLFYFIHISYILESTVGIFPFFVFASKI